MQAMGLANNEILEFPVTGGERGRSGSYRDHHTHALFALEVQRKVNPELPKIEQTFTELADNGDWMANNLKKTVHREDVASTLTLSAEEGRILRCRQTSHAPRRN